MNTMELIDKAIQRQDFVEFMPVSIFGGVMGLTVSVGFFFTDHFGFLLWLTTLIILYQLILTFYKI